MASLGPVTRAAIQHLVGGQPLTGDGVKAVIDEIMSGLATPAQVGAFLVALRMHPTTPELLDSCARGMLGFAAPCPVKRGAGPMVDIVGTGGDGMDTFNVSTAASFVLAACGAVVAKHGNRSSSGAVGSADFLEALGARIDLNGDETARVVNETGFGFLFAPMFHPSMKHVSSARKEIGVRTVFNFLGPLTNPTCPPYQVTGVGTREMGPLFAQLFALRNVDHAVIVHSDDGMDEISPATTTRCWFIRGQEIEERTIHPSDFGLKDHHLNTVAGGTAEDRAAAFRNALAGEEGAIQDFVLLNAALALFIVGKVDNFKAGTSMAREAITSGRALEVLNKYVALTQAIKTESKKETILEKIAKQRRADVEEARGKVSLESLKAQLASAPTLGDFGARLALNLHEGPSVIAEIKRASPSKGDIAPDAVAADQGVAYAKAGAASISVLTEPTWFKGTLQDMLDVRLAVGEEVGEGPNRPCILRKDFVVDEYQIYEARVWGADTVLLIVTMLSDDELRPLLACARSLGMEPLVEVASDEEMHRAIALGAKIVGINNRDLHSFTMDMSRTERVVAAAGDKGAGLLIAALSGINTRLDVQRYTTCGASAVLVGESLMRAADPAAKIRELQGRGTGTLVKICGLKDVPTAVATAKAGADFIGLVFAKSSRQVSTDVARQITQALHALSVKGGGPAGVGAWSGNGQYHTAADTLRLRCSRGPLVVGVFADQPPEEVASIAKQVGLDVVQLSGREGMQAAENFPDRCVIKAVHVGKDMTPEALTAALTEGMCPTGPALCLLDTKDAAALGGTGLTFDWHIAVAASSTMPLFLAGGLQPDNIVDAVAQVRPFGVDVSSGVETAGHKDIAKITEFIRNAKSV